MGYWVAVVDDEPLSLTNAKNLLRAHGMRVSCLRSGQELMDFVGNHTPDLILLDILMPEMDGFETYRALRALEDREERSRIPVIFLTGEDSNETERRGLKAGASDYIHKPFDKDVLIKRIINTIKNSKTIESLTEEANTDKLTGLWNKNCGTEKISECCRSVPGVLMILDLDNFKLVNDLYGHDMGDRVLVAFAGLIRENVRSGDVLCRIGGDEFMGFLADVARPEEVASLTERINLQFKQKTDELLGQNHGIPVGISVGAAFVSETVKEYPILFQCADNALYEVKRNGKHGYSVYDPKVSGSDGQTDLECELHDVIQIMSERGDGTGAMILGQDAFSWNYRFIERFLTRFGGEAERILFSLSSRENGVIYTEMVSEFGNALRNSIRKTDIIFQRKQNLYFVVLPLLKGEDTDRVVGRILRAWTENGFHDRMNIEYATSTLRKKRYESKE